MRQFIPTIVIALSIIFFTGCNLETDSQVQVTLPASPTPNAPVESATATPTVPFATEPLPTTTAPSTTTAPLPTPCSTNAGWTATYTVQAGDTLSAIARRSSTTVDALRNGNCLADANQIAVGQVLYVPIIPIVEATSLGPPSPNPVQVGGRVAVAPILRNEDGWLVLQAGATVTISWPNAEQLGAVEVHFTLAPTGTGATPSIIGFDHDTSDGVSLQWLVPEGVMGHLEARAGTLGGRVLADQTEFPVSIRSVSGDAD